MKRGLLFSAVLTLVISTQIWSEYRNVRRVASYDVYVSSSIHAQVTGSSSRLKFPDDTRTVILPIEPRSLSREVGNSPFSGRPELNSGYSKYADFFGDAEEFEIYHFSPARSSHACVGISHTAAVSVQTYNDPGCRRCYSVLRNTVSGDLIRRRIASWLTIDAVLALLFFLLYRTFSTSAKFETATSYNAAS